ncbi:3-mercaptopyruvate sulfurtransferase [Phyllobacterium sp. 0TCS1.6C]|uniref:3-mercaptopyruvate sulfurtransferase n=1 Tax=unclassified Phyllobacterium TaxID=2638441 RepID=UPI002263AF75|nr:MULTISPECIES: 3-mercaptopyruvate sulfurtransferase [unclassified Phyllobacterium]MCX8282560.1 3-mercaptopyruvate sulfurtransferase [Phyllobacterium sp. 0TCS1.6C]MCX8292508.1 3-mercaptopyruvate sulfurtransferase [Phyllobacterium sp. 0TCS1.6A]
MSEKSPFVVSADWLQERLQQPGLTVLDASWYFPFQNRDAKAEYDAAHIPGAIFFDHEKTSDPASSLPHTLPKPEAFAAAASSMGIANDDTIVIYDGPGMYTSPRVWWMFRIMGARNVHVLDGGFDNWKKAGRPVTAEATRIAPTAFVADFDAARVASFEQMLQIVQTGSRQVADARSAGRFKGVDPEPRQGLRSGHMPGARNVPSSTLADNGYLKDLDGLRRVLGEAGVDLDRPIATTCGSGITAAVITLALESLGHGDNVLYDGSWTEWGGSKETPVATGDA